MSAAHILVVGVRPPLAPFLAQLLAGLRGLGHRVTIASSAPPASAVADRWLPVPGGSGLPVRAAAGLVAHDPIGGARRLVQLASNDPGRVRSDLHRAVLHTARPDAVYVPWVAHAVDHPEVFDLGAPVVVSCRGSQINVAPHNPSRAALAEGLPVVFERAAVVHGVSRAILAAASELGLDRRKATVIRPAVDLDRFPPAPVRPATGPLRLLMTGVTPYWLKGVEYALLGLRAAIDRGLAANLRLVGLGDDGGATRHAITDLGLEAVVELEARIPAIEVPGRVRAADVVLVTSVAEGIANAAVEAMSTARAVVVSDVGGMTELITDGADGRVVPPRDPAAIADALIELRSAERRRELGRRARETVERRHRLDDQVTAFSSMIREVC